VTPPGPARLQPPASRSARATGALRHRGRGPSVMLAIAWSNQWRSSAARESSVHTCSV
jgi:hypothetical protein